MSSDHSLIFKTSFVQRISKSRCNHHAMDRGPYCKRPLNETSYVAAVLFAMKMLRGHKDEKAKQWLCMITNRGEYSADIADYPVKLTMWWCTSKNLERRTCSKQDRTCWNQVFRCFCFSWSRLSVWFKFLAWAATQSWVWKIWKVEANFFSLFYFWQSYKTFDDIQARKCVKSMRCLQHLHIGRHLV